MVRRSFRFLPVLLAGLLAACGGDPHESARDDGLDAAEDFISILEEVETPEDVESRQADFEEVIADMKAAGERIKELEEPSKEREKELKEQFQSRMDELEERMTKVMERLGEQPEMQRALMPVMMKFGRAAEEFN